MYKALTALMVISAACGQLAAAADFSVCSGATDHLGVDAVTLSPAAPAGGETLTVTMKGTTDDSTAVSSGTAALSIKAFGITIGTVNFDICKDLGVECPVAPKTTWTGKISYNIPSAAPAGITVSVETKITTGVSTQLSCIDLSLKLGSKAQTGFGQSNWLAGDWSEYLFRSWIVQHGKHNEDWAKSAGEYVRRHHIFEENLRKILVHNAQGGSTFTMAMNEFGHLTSDEFKESYTGFKRSRPTSLRRGFGNRRQLSTIEALQILKNSAQSSVDWVADGAVTSVKNQGQCGSCWTFSATGALEGAYYLSSGTLEDLSMQQIVDCDTGGNGCSGGLMDQAFTWIKSNGGLCSLDSYPYTSSGGTAGTCESSCSVVSGTKVDSYTDVDSTETALMAAVSKQPVSIAIEADQSSFQFYSSGVLTSTCGNNLDHGVLLVGYGEDSGTKYWKVKNSWGTGWGEEGYIRLERGKDVTGGQCGILSQPSYPTLA